LQYSTDGGMSWIDIALDLPNSELSYTWTIPDVITSEAQVKIIMDNTGADYEDESDLFGIGTTITSLNERLLNNSVNVFPNPFSISTTFQVHLDTPAKVDLRIFNQIGRQIYSNQVYINQQGIRSIHWNPKNQSAGIYYYKLLADKESSSGKIYLRR
jgi:hypothetical protein